MENNLSGSQSSSVSELEKRIFPRKAKRVKFLRNGDKFFPGIIIPVLVERYRSFDSLIADLTRILMEHVNLPNGVRSVYTVSGRKILKVEDLEEGHSYVCSGVGESFKHLDYQSIQSSNLQSLRLRPNVVAHSSNNAPKIPRCAKANGTAIRSHIATFIRNGTKPRKVCRLLLNKRNSQSLEQLMEAITECVKLDTGCVRKVFTQAGTLVTTLHEFFEKDVVFFAYGNERVNPEDFELDFEEGKAVLQCRKPAITRTIRKNGNPGMPVKAGRAGRGLEAASSGEAPMTLDPQLMPKPLQLKYGVGEIIGDGNFAVVRLCFNKATGQKYALKVIDKLKSKGKEHYIAAEVRVMRQLSHPRIVTLYDEFHTSEWLLLVLEYVSGGDLFDNIAAATKYSEPQCRLVINHLASAIAYLHSLSIVHRDIKPENLLVELAPDGSIRGLKLADFGLAVEVLEPLKVICGTPTYVAPEILLEDGYGLKIDVWAAGVILYVMLCGFPPYSSPDGEQEKLFDAILSGRLEFPVPYWEHVSAGAIDLVANMLHAQPELRLAAKDVLEHVWMSDDYDGPRNHLSWHDEDSS